MMGTKKTIKPLSSSDQIYAKELIRKLDRKIRQCVGSYLDPGLSSEFEDIVQSVYEQICRQLEDFKTCDSPAALVSVIAARAVWHVHRDRKPTQELTEDIPAAEADCGLGEILPAHISDRDREILTAVYERQDTMEELARDLRCPSPTLRQRLKRAKARMKKSIDGRT